MSKLDKVKRDAASLSLQESKWLSRWLLNRIFMLEQDIEEGEPRPAHEIVAIKREATRSSNKNGSNAVKEIAGVLPEKGTAPTGTNTGQKTAKLNPNTSGR